MNAISLQEFLNTLILVETQQSMNIPCARGLAFVLNSSPFKALQNFTASQDISISINLFPIFHCK